MAIRVHQLAKELNVKSAAIVSKCQAEGLEIKNHMSTLSVGLAETIREWFSEGAHDTTIEETARVDLEKVKTKTKRKKKTTAAKKTEDNKSTETAVAEEPKETTDVDETKSVVTKKKATRPKRKSPKDLETEQQAEAGSEQTTETIKPAASSEPEKPEEIKNAPVIKPVVSEPFIPTPAKLQGPNVVRMEHADHVPVPPSRPPKRKPLSEPISNSLSINADKTQDGKKSPVEMGGIPETGKKGSRRRVLESDEDEQQNKRGKGKGRSRSRSNSDADAGASKRWRERDWQEREERLAQASGMKLHRRERRLAQNEIDGSGGKQIYKKTQIDKATVKEPITVKELSSAIGVRSTEIIAKLMGMGVMANINQVIETDAAETISLEFGVELSVEAHVQLIDQLLEEFDKETPDDDKSPRPPVVTFLGHVDHGKTSLLDCIRKESVASGEAGGITQHIGSYLYDDGKRRVTFLDTPGHKAFTAMRARGANMTDIAVLVVAADDGVMPQTEEAINHIKAANVPIVVAMNKMDLPAADENRVLGQLAEKGLVPTEWGGDVEVVKTSAHTGNGITDLVEYLDYIAELNNLKAKKDGAATGWIVESEMSSGQGVIARILVKQGTLKAGDVIVSGSSYGRVRTILDSSNKSLKEAGPATPCEISGLEGVPTAGDRFFVLDNISKAKEVADEQRSQEREKTLAQRSMVTLENLFSEIEAGEIRELNIILKADVQGSVDVLSKSILEMNTSEVAVRVLHAAVGGISESDVVLAQASNAIIIGFQVIADEYARTYADKNSVEIRLYRVIYQISEDIKKALEGMLKPRVEEKELGRAEVRQVFKVSRLGNIAGCYATEGLIKRSAKIRLIRDNIILRDNLSIDSLKRVKDDVNEIRSGLEFGIKLVDCDDIKEGDQLEVYDHIEISRTLESVQ